MRILVLTFFLVSISVATSAQTPTLSLGAEYNYYPAGHIVGFQAEYSPNNNHHSINARLASNITRRKDFSGLNDDERGIGYGGSLGYRYYFSPAKNSLYLGIRTDLWFLSIDWQDSSELIKEGNTKITVVQPTFEVGYLFQFEKGWNFSLAVGNGMEINVITKGEPVGEGFITLGQIRLAKQINLRNN